MAKLDSGYGGLSGHSHLGRRNYRSLWTRTLEFAGRPAHGRDLICHFWAAMFCIFVVTPTTFIFWDRQLPFENLHTFASPAITHPGEKVNIVVTLINVRRNCSGYIDRLIVDARGNIFYQGKFPLVYQYGNTPDRHFIKTAQVPTKDEGVAPGPALYRALPTFWCNPIQRLWPIEGKPMEVPFTIVPEGITVPEVLAAPSRLGEKPADGGQQ